MRKVAVLGYGQLGRALVAALGGGDERGAVVWTRREIANAERQAGVGFFAGAELTGVISEAELVFLAVPDGELPKFVERLARLELPWRGKVVLHASGVSASELLEPLAVHGAAVAACHPLRAFPVLETGFGSGGHGRNPFAGTLFTIEGTPEGVEAARKLTLELGGVPLTARITDRAGYHLAATIASNYGLIVRDWSARRFEAAGLSREQAARASDALLRNALDNALAAPGRLALTGPIRRGDLATLEAHLGALSGSELLAYSALGLLVLASAAPRDATAAEAISEALRSALDRGAREEAGQPTGGREAVAGRRR